MHPAWKIGPEQGPHNAEMIQLVCSTYSVNAPCSPCPGSHQVWSVSQSVSGRLDVLCVNWKSFLQSFTKSQRNDWLQDFFCLIQWKWLSSWCAWKCFSSLFVEIAIGINLLVILTSKNGLPKELYLTIKMWFISSFRPCFKSTPWRTCSVAQP